MNKRPLMVASLNMKGLGKNSLKKKKVPFLDLLPDPPPLKYCFYRNTTWGK
jgi:hypothetical protein